MRHAGRAGLVRYAYVSYTGGIATDRWHLQIGDIVIDITMIDSDTLELARMVASAEGISLSEAIADQESLFGTENN